jgi:hypothetical protein
MVLSALVRLQVAGLLPARLVRLLALRPRDSLFDLENRWSEVYATLI